MISYSFLGCQLFIIVLTVVLARVNTLSEVNSTMRLLEIHENAKTYMRGFTVSLALASATVVGLHIYLWPIVKEGSLVSEEMKGNFMMVYDQMLYSVMVGSICGIAFNWGEMRTAKKRIEDGRS